MYTSAAEATMTATYPATTILNCTRLSRAAGIACARPVCSGTQVCSIGTILVASDCCNIAAKKVRVPHLVLPMLRDSARLGITYIAVGEARPVCTLCRRGQEYPRCTSY